MGKTLAAIGGMILSFQLFASGTVWINGKTIQSKEHLHSYLAKELNFPSFYNSNLDSLYDVLSTDYFGQTFIKIKHINILKAKLGSDYVEALIQAIRDAADDNPRIMLMIE